MKISDTIKALGFMFLAASAIGCGSDAQAICDKYDECNLLAGVSVDDCVELGEKLQTESKLADCAACVEGKSCDTIKNGDCNAACQ